MFDHFRPFFLMVFSVSFCVKSIINMYSLSPPFPGPPLNLRGADVYQIPVCPAPLLFLLSMTYKHL